MTKVKLRLIKECVALSTTTQLSFPALCSHYKGSNCCDAIGELSVKMEPPTQHLTIEMQNGMILDTNDERYDWTRRLDIDKRTKSRKWYVKGHNDTPDTLNMRLMETDASNIMRSIDFEFDIDPVTEFQKVPEKKIEKDTTQIEQDTQSYFEQLQMLECNLPILNAGTYGTGHGEGNDDDDITTTNGFIRDKEIDDMSPRSFKRFISSIKPPKLTRNAKFVSAPQPFPSVDHIIHSEEVTPHNMMI